MEEGQFTVLVTTVLTAVSLLLWRVISVMSLGKRRKNAGADGSRGGSLSALSGRMLILLGSGGHTGEMLRILEQNKEVKGLRRDYVISSGDETSLRKLQQFEENTSGEYKVINVYRARNVGDSKSIAIWKSFLSFIDVLRKIEWKHDLFLTNGPGTAVPIGYTLFALRILGISNCRIVYVESLARVNDLSLTGKLLLPVSDRIIVQWPSLVKRYKRCEYYGMLV